MKRFVLGCVVIAAMLAGHRRAEAYEFWLRARSIGQAYQVRDFRLVGPDLFLGRRRYVETLALRIWDIGGLAEDRRIKRLPERGVRIAWQSYLRIDHDFGTYTNEKIQFPDPAVRRDALDVIPELGDSVANISLLYGYMSIEGMFDDHLTVQVGRTLADDGWGTTAIDGASARVELPQPISITASAGLRVRQASLLGVTPYELDGTSGAGCMEFREGQAPGTGAWQLIDRNRTITNTKLSSDYEYCPQREVRQPSIGVTIATSRIRTFGAELGYRRTSSETFGLIGAPDRLNTTDLSLYPQGAPPSGVNEERLWARGHADLSAGAISIGPYAGVRASLLHALVDRGELGVRIARGSHSLEPALAYFYPTFDGDSIFNVFSIEPTADARLGYRYAPADKAWTALADGWVRKYVGASEDAYAGGIDAGLEHAMSTTIRGRANVLADTGYGGRRAGGTLELAWRPSRQTRTFARGLSIWTKEDSTLTAVLARNTVTSAATLGASFQVARQVAIHITGETTYDDVHELQLRAFAVLDLAFEPEP